MQAHLVSDTHLAALAIQHGLILCSTDGDFARLKICAGKIRFRLSGGSASGYFFYFS
jgi:predicted nuclease of predicted toxin-antitoxin system